MDTANRWAILQAASWPGFNKIKFKKAGLRVVYALQRVEGKMVVVIISARADDFVYYEAEKQRKKHDL